MEVASREKIQSTKGLFNLAEKGISKTHGWMFKPDKFKLGTIVYKNSEND